MNITERISLLAELGKDIRTQKDLYEGVIHRAFMQNQWFNPEYIQLALRAIATEFLDASKLNHWAAHYGLKTPEKTLRIGVIMAGNIPLVGFHDWLAVIMTGHTAIIKLSEKDNALFPFLLERLKTIDERTTDWTIQVERLQDFDAVIATGSNNTARYFETYFAKYPHIIRKNRNSVAILTGAESDEDLKRLGIDIFRYFGLGCRNVSKLYIPKNYDLSHLLKVLDIYSDIQNHNKYRNNLDYNRALLLLNQMPHLTNDCIIFQENEALISRIGVIHYEYYDDTETLKEKLSKEKENIQCIVSALPIPPFKTILFGETQSPSLFDYPDEVDCIDFLQNLFP